MAARKRQKTAANVKAKAKQQINRPKEAAQAKLTLRRGEPELVQLGQDTLKSLAGDWDRKRVQATLRDVASRKKSLEAALLEVATGARDALQKVAGEVGERSEAEQQLDRQYREQLLAQAGNQRGRRARQGEIRLQGRVLHPKTGAPVGGVLVQAIDKDVFKHDLLGVVVTDAEGRFEMLLQAKDYRESGEGRPEIVLSVGADRRTMFYVADRPLELASERPEPVTITLSEDRADAVDAFVEGLERGQANRRAKAGAAKLQRELQNQAAGAVGDAAVAVLTKGIGLLSERIRKAGG